MYNPWRRLGKSSSMYLPYQTMKTYSMLLQLAIAALRSATVPEERFEVGEDIPLDV